MGAPNATTTEVLCGTTTTRLDPTPLSGRQGVSIYNHGPNPLWIVITNTASPTVVVDKAVKIGLEETWGPYQVSDSVYVYGITTNANQVTGAATIVMQYGGLFKFAPYTLDSSATSTVPLTINGLSGQTANLQNWSVNGSQVAHIDAAGNFSVTAGATGNVLYKKSDGTVTADSHLTWDSTADQLSLSGTTSPSIVMTAIASDPPSPAAGRITVFGEDYAGRDMLTVLTSDGIDFPVQTILGMGRNGWWNPPGNGATVPGVCGIQTLTAVGTPTGRNITTTNLFTRSKRLGYVSASSVGSITSVRTASAQYSLGAAVSPAPIGGFYLTWRFGCSDAATVANARQFVGLWSTTTAPTNAEPSTLTNAIGIGNGAANSNLFMYYGGSAAQSPIDLGTNFPANTLSTDLYQLILYNSCASSTAVGYKVIRLNTGHEASGTINAGTPGLQLPANTTLLSLVGWRSNNTTALAVGIDMGSIYIETEV
jgi:hypothetical protein